MADAPDTKVPVLARLDPRARLLSYVVKDDITAPAQYYPYPLPRIKKPESANGITNGNGLATSNEKGNDRSVIIYGTKTGLTLLYPRRSRVCRGQAPSRSANEVNETRADMEMDVDGGSWIVFHDSDTKPLTDPLRKQTPVKAPKYESYSEPEEYDIQRNARFPWKYLVELGSPVVEFAIPGASHSVPEYAYLESHPWLEKMYIAAITADGKAHLVILPLRLPPPGISSADIASNDFPVHTILLRARSEGRTRPIGICLDFMRRKPNPASP
ncbi:hypothetical protein TWF281_000468 [Arthrobotrys megalospora]